jgi:hypothetical protein
MTTTYDQTKDPSAGFQGSPSTRGSNSFAVSPSDTVDLASYPLGIVVTVAGNLVVLPLKAVDDGSHLITFTSAPAGFVVPFRVRRVMSTNTTASVATIEL